MNNTSIKIVQQWFKKKKWKPFPFQEKTWNAVLEGHSGLLNAATGSGKTLALCLPFMMKALNSDINSSSKGIQLLWITPLRALAKDLVKAMETTCTELGLSWQVGFRTGDTDSKTKQRQQRNMPEILLITPESLHILFAQKNHQRYFNNVKGVVVDEWHELLGSKRGVLTQLAVSHLRGIANNAQIWGISATIANLRQAADVLLPEELAPVIIQDDRKALTEIIPLLPDEIEHFPWSGHLGLSMIHQVIPILRSSSSTLVFTNTRAQCELWYQELLREAPEFAGKMALHHGSINGAIRTWIEDALKEGSLKVVVCTSTLDLGVDFHPVETIIQIGSPKGVGRFLQRAGRSGHRPDTVSKAYLVPTHALEIIETVALKRAVEQEAIEPRIPFEHCSDLMIQFMMTLATGDGLHPETAYNELIKTHAFRKLSRKEFDHHLTFLTKGGKALAAYDDYKKVVEEKGIYRVTQRRIAMRHRLSIGAIMSEPSIRIKFLKGGTIGTTEEWFISQIQLGDTFWFGGRSLELVSIKENTAFVRSSKTKKGVVPRWMGGRMPLSSKLSASLREVLGNWKEITKHYEVYDSIQPILEIQEQWSALPDQFSLVWEKSTSREGYHVFCYPMEGRLVHEAMASLCAYRMAQKTPITFSIAMNDYGFELLSDQPIPLEEALDEGLLSTENLEQDIFASINETEMIRRRFREIAQLGGLLFVGFPGKMKKDRHLQSSSNLLYSVFSDHEPDSPLLQQARREVLYHQLEIERLQEVFESVQHRELKIMEPPKFSPFAFPIYVDRLRERMSSEKLADRIARMHVQLEKAVATSVTFS